MSLIGTAAAPPPRTWATPPPGASLTRPGRGRLLRKYASLLVALVGSALLVSAAVESYHSYVENRQALVAAQRAKAQGAAAVIGRFLAEIEGQLGWTTHAAVLDSGSARDQRRLDFLRLLRQAPAITEVAYVDPGGREQLRVSRLSMDVVGGGEDRSGEPAWRGALEHGRFIGPVYFRQGSEPYLTLAIPERGRRVGVILAEVNLKFILDVVSRIEVGAGGVAYAVDRRGLLIAHPDIGLVLRRTDMSDLEHVRSALSSASADRATAIARDRTGQQVLTAHAPVDGLGWQVFVEQPLAQAFAAIRSSLVRTALIAIIGVALAAMAAYWLARRMVVPIRLLAEGAARIGSGDLDQRIAIRTGDEIETLAEQFNDMAARLAESYRDLEGKVEARTRDLSEALEQQTATGEILRTISGSPTDVQPVFETIVRNAVSLCGSLFANVFRFDGEFLHLAASHNLGPGYRDLLREKYPLRPDASQVSGRVLLSKAVVRLEDALADPDYDQRFPNAMVWRRMLGVPMLRGGDAVGVIVVGWAEAGPVPKRQEALLQTFADQAVIAIENVRLFQEIEEKSRQIEIASQHKSQFLANMSHELRTPLNAILGYAELMQDGVYGALGPKLETILERVQANGRHLLGLINDVLDLSKIEAGQLELRLQDYSLADVVQTVVQATESLAREKGLALEASVPADLPVARGDERRIAQVLLNLVGNAIKFTDEGSVRVAVRAKRSKFVIEVRDTGRGIPEAEQERIFEEFHQVDSSNTKEKGGTGLGLAIARRMLLLHGGRISVHSKPGAGATFRVDLPIRVEMQRRVD